MRVGGVGPAAGLEDELVHARQLAQRPGPAGRRSPARPASCPRAAAGAARAPRCSRETDSEPRVVLHRAGAEQADAHHAERLLGQVQVVALHLELGQLGQLPGRGSRAHGAGISSPGRRGRCDSRLDRRDQTAPRRPARPMLHDDRLVPDRRRGSGAGRLRAGHAVTSASASASRSMSACGVGLGHAVQRAVAELREARGRGRRRRRCRARAARRRSRRPCLPVAEKSTTNSLKKPGGNRTRRPGSSSSRLRRVMAALQDRVAELGEPGGSHQRHVGGVRDRPQVDRVAGPVVAVLARAVGGLLEQR